MTIFVLCITALSHAMPLYFIVLSTISETGDSMKIMRKNSSAVYSVGHIFDDVCRWVIVGTNADTGSSEMQHGCCNVAEDNDAIRNVNEYVSIDVHSS